MSTTRLSFLALIGLIALLGQQGGAQVSLTVDTDKVVARIDPKVYGQFYELIYHSGNGGLWSSVMSKSSGWLAPAGAIPEFGGPS